jgi:hypothetical protein
MSGKRMTEKELLKEYEERWVNEGFLSREHEEMMKGAGILSQDYRAKPDWHNCGFCEFRTICPDSYAC